MSSVVGGLVGTAGLVAFGTGVPSVAVVGGTIDLTGGALGTTLDEAFVVPRAGTINAIYASFSNVLALTLVGTTVTVTAQLYSSPVGSTVFSPLAGTAVNLAPALTGIVAVGSVSTGSATGLAVPVPAGTRLLLAYTITATGLDLVQAVTGFASAGVSII